MAKAPGERRVSAAALEFLKQPPRTTKLTPRRRVVSETSHADGLRVLHLECGHECRTRGHAVLESTVCVLCGVYD